VTGSNFVRNLDRQALYLFVLFLARFFLNYVNKFAFRMIGIRMSAAIRAHYLRCLFMQTIHILDSSKSVSGTIVGFFPPIY
jgi:ATP-binding cassette, subfamily B (MDR/TAP), member 1